MVAEGMSFNKRWKGSTLYFASDRSDTRGSFIARCNTGVLGGNLGKFIHVMVLQPALFGCPCALRGPLFVGFDLIADQTIKDLELRQRPELGNGAVELHRLMAEPADRNFAGCVPHAA
jgi:hypothetical protein